MMLPAFVLGIVTGSFLNVCIYRIPLGRSVVSPGSACPDCGRLLRWFELVPLAGYIFLRGRCRSCGARISPRYPVVELLTGLLFGGAYARYGFSLDALALVVLGSLLTVVSFVDMEHRIIPNGLVLTGLASGIVFGLARPGTGAVFMLTGLAAGFGLMLAVTIGSRGQMGMGDVKLAAVAGVYLGWRGMLAALFIAFVSGALYGLFLMVFMGKSRKTAVPFGPFLSVGTAVSFVWSDNLIMWYLNIIS